MSKKTEEQWLIEFERKLVGKEYSKSVYSELESSKTISEISESTILKAMLWKINRLPDAKGIVEVLNEIQEIINVNKRELHPIYNIEKKFNELLKLNGMGLATASMMLHVTWPDSFPIYDQRAWRMIEIFRGESIRNEKNDLNIPYNKYEFYIRMCKDLISNPDKNENGDGHIFSEYVEGDATLKNIDKILYEMDKIDFKNKNS